MKACLEETKELDVIVNCAALSQTGKCEELKDQATSFDFGEPVPD